MNINWDSIEEKINKYINSSEGKQRLAAASKDAVFGKGADISISMPGQAGEKFIDCLERAKMNIVQTDSPNAAAAMGSWYYEVAESKSGKSFVVNICPVDEDRSRESVQPDKYPDGIKDILVLLDSGYHASSPTYGPWHGRIIKTRDTFAGYHFIDQAIKEFKNNYKKSLNVKKINKPVLHKDWTEFDEE